jgi:hypothetical protein
MRRRRLLALLVEVVFLAGLAALAAIAHMRAVEVIGVMAFGWVVVALLEWSSWLDRPHFGRGLPPRFYVPQVSLPPALPPDEARARLSERAARAADAETWIAPPSNWAPSLDEWPVLDLDQLGDDSAFLAEAAPGEDTEIAAPSGERGSELAEPQTGQIVLPPGGLEPGRLRDALEPPEPEPEPEAEPSPAQAASGPVASPPPPEPERPGRLGAAGSAPPASLSRHRIDPFASPLTVSRRGRRRREERAFVELPARPPADRPLPAALAPAADADRP